MSDSHGSHGSHDAHDAKGHHAHPEPEEDPLQTPGWMPFLGLGLLMAGALWMYLFVSPGVWSPSTGDGGADGGDASAEAPATPH